VPIRYAAIAFGGAMAGLAGAYMSLAYTPLWAQDLTAGRGWVAVALVTFAAWRPFWLLIGAWLFGALMYLSLYVQAIGLHVPTPLLSALPYLGTIVMLVFISRDKRRIRLNRPAMLGRQFSPRV
jgi:simple sugar transport system permease protein